LPEVPTFAEASGLADFEIVAWHALVVAAGTPTPIVGRLHTEMKRIMSDFNMQQRISNMGLLPIDPPSITETERYIKSETAKWKGILEIIGLTASQ